MTIKIENTPTSNDSLPTILYDDLFSLGTVSASTEATDYPKENAASEATTSYWQPTALPAWLEVDHSASTANDCAAIIAHTLGTNGCTVTLQGSADNVSWSDVTSTTPTDDTTIFLLFTSVSYRYWRIYITGSGSVPYIGRFMIGSRFNFPAGVVPPYNPVWLSQTYTLLTATTLGGQFIGNRVLRQGGGTTINLVSLERDFAESNLLPFREHYNLGKAFVWASGPAIFTKDVGYVWRKEGSIMAPTFDQNGSFMSVGMEVYAYGE